MCSVNSWASTIACPIEFLLLEIQTWTNHFPFTILLVAFLIKFVMFPLYLKGRSEAKKLALVAPKLKKLKEEFKDDPRSLILAQQGLYQSENISPMKSVLLQVLSLPIYYGVYLVLANAATHGLGGQWLWINDLNLPDPFYLIPLVLSALIVISQIAFPMGPADKPQLKMIGCMGLISAILMSQLPAQIVLFYLCMTACQILFDCLWKAFHRSKTFRRINP